MNKKLAIIGASGHGKVVADIATKNGYTDIVFLDDNVLTAEYGGYSLIGTSKDAALCRDRDFIVAIGNAHVRESLLHQLAGEGYRVVTLIHPHATIGKDVALGEGTVVMAGAVINPGARVGKGGIINTCSSVDHDCIIGEYVHISVGAHIAGTVRIGDRTWIGAGATISNNVAITSDCMIGAGAVVVGDLLESDTYIGVPARKMVTSKECSSK